MQKNHGIPDNIYHNNTIFNMRLHVASDGGLAPPTPGKFKLPPLKLDKIKREGNPNFGSQQFTMTSVTRKDFDAEPLHAATSTTLQKGGLLAAIHVK